MDSIAVRANYDIHSRASGAFWATVLWEEVPIIGFFGDSELELRTIAILLIVRTPFFKEGISIHKNWLKEGIKHFGPSFIRKGPVQSPLSVRSLVSLWLVFKYLRDCPLIFLIFCIKLGHHKDKWHPDICKKSWVVTN